MNRLFSNWMGLVIPNIKKIDKFWFFYDTAPPDLKSGGNYIQDFKSWIASNFKSWIASGFKSGGAIYIFSSPSSTCLNLSASMARRLLNDSMADSVSGLISIPFKRNNNKPYKPSKQVSISLILLSGSLLFRSSILILAWWK